MQTTTSYEHRHPQVATREQEQERAERTQLFLQRFQQLLEEHPPQNGILHFRGWPAPGQPLDRVHDPEFEARIARARHEDELEREALDAAVAEPPGARPEFVEQLEHSTPASSPTSPRPPPEPSVQAPETDVVERGGRS